jgi:hypothetical protein
MYMCVYVCVRAHVEMCAVRQHNDGKSGHRWKQARMIVSSGCTAAAVHHRTPVPAASRVPAALLAVFALAPDPAVGAHSFATAVAAEAIVYVSKYILARLGERRRGGGGGRPGSRSLGHQYQEPGCQSSVTFENCDTTYDEMTQCMMMCHYV